MRRFMLPLLVFVLVLVIGAAGLLVWKEYPWLLSKAYALRVATPPLSDAGGKLITAFKRELANERPHVLVETVETPSLAASALAFKNHEVDLAVVRSDDPNAAEGRSVFVFRKLFAVVLVPADSKAESIADLAGQKIGVLTSGPDIDPLARAVLDFYSIDDKRITRLTPTDLADGLKRVRALLVVGPIGPGPIATAVQAFRKLTKKPPTFLDLKEADAVAARYPVYEAVDLPQGSFGGSPAVPADDTKALAASLLLIAQPSLLNFAAGEFTRLLLATKTNIARSLPGAGEMAAPSTDRDALLPAHPGTMAYLNGDAPSVLDEAMNVISIGTLVVGAFGALAAWATSLRNRRQLRELKKSVERLPALLEEIKKKPVAGLDSTQSELDRLTEWFVEKYVTDKISSEVFDSAAARVMHLRDLIKKRQEASQVVSGEQVESGGGVAGRRATAETES